MTQSPTPEGIGAPRENIAASVDGPTQVFRLAMDGYWSMAVEAMTRLPDEQWETLVMAVGGLSGALNTIARDRRARVRVVSDCIPAPQNPPATSG